MDHAHPERRTVRAAEMAADEAERLAALLRTELLDTPPAEAFQRVVIGVADTLKVPMVLITLVDSDRQWFLARHGVKIGQAPRSISLSNHVVETGRSLHVPDTSAHEVFAQSPLVVSGPKLRAYLGEPLRSIDGHVLGALCVLDRRVREFSVVERQILLRYARAVEQLMRR